MNLKLDNKDLKPGEFVYVIRKQESHKNWDYCWSSQMDLTVGKRFEIKSLYTFSTEFNHRTFLLNTSMLGNGIRGLIYPDFVYPDFILSRNKKHVGKMPKEPKWKSIWKD